MITNEAVNHAIDYILHHINEKLAVDEIADYCHFSKYYFSRMLKKQTGESVYAFIKRVKLEPERSITDIGFEMAYSPSCMIRGGKCAVYSYKGPKRQIYAAYQNIFLVWLPRTCYEPDTRCGFDIYYKADNKQDYMEMVRIGIGSDFSVKRAGDTFGLYFYIARIFWNDGSMACRPGDGGGNTRNQWDNFASAEELLRFNRMLS